MEMTVSLLGDIKRISLRGRLDLLGTQAIDLPFTAQAAGEKALVLVDLTGVDFMASIGLRTLITSAKAQKARGGRMVLCGAPPLVAQVLVTSGVSTMIPVAADENAGLALLRS